MTCIVGFTDGHVVTMGGDSAGVSGWDMTVRSDSKVWSRNGWAFGFTTSFRMGQILRYRLALPKMTEDQTVEHFMTVTFVDAVRSALKDGGWAMSEKGQEEGGTFLVGYKGRLFTVHSDYQVAESSEPFAACGCGQSFAIGALHAMGPKVTAYDRVMTALDVAAKCSAGVSAPFTIVTTEADDA